MKTLIFLFASVLIATISIAQNQTKNPFNQGDVWVGYYECRGNKLVLKLTIEEVQGSIVRSKFIFLNGNGSFDLIGKFENNEFTFNSSQWDRNPGGYVTLGMHGFFLANPDRLIGNTISKLTYTEGNECTGFSLTKQK